MFDPVNYTVSLYENSREGTPLVNVTATDADSGQNARITYTVTGGDPFSVFTVDTQVTLFMLSLGMCEWINHQKGVKAEKLTLKTE